MKVLKRKEWSYKYTCFGCGSELLVEPGDVRYGVSGIDAEGGYYCECAVCKVQHDLDRAKIPEDRKAKAYDAFRKRNP